MRMEEQKRLMRIAVETSDRRVPIVAGTGSNCTREAVELTSFAKKAGCDGALIITPYYNKPTPEGQYRHYAEIAKKAQMETVELMMAAGKDFSEDATAAVKKATNEATAAVKKAAAK